ncbi:MAG: MFS transporter, partial [Burkholderiaceae bacterium]|nr:MFS transporter [Burkholderiaceae bacterium]
RRPDVGRRRCAREHGAHDGCAGDEPEIARQAEHAGNDAALAGVPAGRLVDRLGAQRMTVAGLVCMAAGCAILPMMPVRFGVPGYIGPLAAITAGYALFQAANNTAVMADVWAEQRGVVAGLLTLSRNLGLVTGASVMGAVFALGAGAGDMAAARPEDVAAGMRITFAVAAALIAAALAIACASHALARRAASRLSS